MDSVNREASRIENDPNLTEEEKREEILALEKAARYEYEEYLEEQAAIDRKYGY